MLYSLINSRILLQNLSSGPCATLHLGFSVPAIRIVSLFLWEQCQTLSSFSAFVPATFFPKTFPVPPSSMANYFFVMACLNVTTLEYPFLTCWSQANLCLLLYEHLL